MVSGSIEEIKRNRDATSVAVESRHTGTIEFPTCAIETSTSINGLTMAGSHMRYRHLSRSSSHRQALLRNLVTSLFEHESISTSWHKAKEAQRLAEKLVTLGKKNTEASRRRALSIFYVCLSS